MVLIFTLVIAVALGTAGALLARAGMLPGIRASERFSRVQSYGYGERPGAEAPRTGVLPGLSAVTTRIGMRLGGSEKRQNELRRVLVSAGAYRIQPSTFIGYQVLAAILTAGLMLYFLLAVGLWPPLAVGLGAYSAVFGWMLPQFVLKSRARQRLQRIELEMPELIDLLVVTVEAGLGLSAAIQTSASRIRGPLGDELKLTLREYALGLSIEQSLQNLVERCDAPATRALIRSVKQAQMLGVSIGQIMRGLGDDLRKRRLQIVQERAQKAPVKMLFPMAFLILPTIFIVVLFPAMYNVIKILAG
jgi:tight adherence protein C